jgi:hypothetical protein
VHSSCAWEEGKCSDPLLAPLDLSFFECAHFCSYEVEGGKIPCPEEFAEQDELLGRHADLGWGGLWLGWGCAGGMEGEGGEGEGECSILAGAGGWENAECSIARACVCEGGEGGGEVDWAALRAEVYADEDGDQGVQCEAGVGVNATRDGCEICGAGM